MIFSIENLWGFVESRIFCESVVSREVGFLFMFFWLLVIMLLLCFISFSFGIRVVIIEGKYLFEIRFGVVVLECLFYWFS